MNSGLVIILLLVNFPLLIKLKQLLYPDPEEFQEAIRFIFTPDFFSLLKGEYMRDRFAEMKFGFMLLNILF